MFCKCRAVYVVLSHREFRRVRYAELADEHSAFALLRPIAVRIKRSTDAVIASRSSCVSRRVSIISSPVSISTHYPMSGEFCQL